MLLIHMYIFDSIPTWIWYIRSPPFKYSITKKRYSYKNKKGSFEKYSSLQICVDLHSSETSRTSDTKMGFHSTKSAPFVRWTCIRCRHLPISHLFLDISLQKTDFDSWVRRATPELFKNKSNPSIFKCLLTFPKLPFPSTFNRLKFWSLYCFGASPDGYVLLLLLFDAFNEPLKCVRLETF